MIAKRDLRQLSTLLDETLRAGGPLKDRAEPVASEEPRG